MSRDEENDPPTTEEIDLARSLAEAIARRERDFEALSADLDRLEEDHLDGETDAEIARLMDLHAAEIARPRAGFDAGQPGGGIVIDPAETNRRLAALEAAGERTRLRLDHLRVSLENLDRKCEGAFAVLLEAARRDAEPVARRSGAFAVLRSPRHAARVGLAIGGALALSLFWRWLAL
ncbi:MAG: hypothetical protein R3F20_19140 [Planctomycetota bacterium]